MFRNGSTLKYSVLIGWHFDWAFRTWLLLAIFRLCENQHGVQCLLGVHEPSSTVFHKDILHCISYDNTEDRNTIFNLTLFVFHNFTTNWTTRNQRCVAFSWLSVMQLRDLNSDIYVDTCILARIYSTRTFTSQKLVAVITLLPKQTCVRQFLPQALGRIL